MPCQCASSRFLFAIHTMPMRRLWLSECRRKLAAEQDAFAEAVEAAKQRVAAEEAAKWEAM